MDNLIADHKAKPMIIVMDNLNAVKPGEGDTLYTARSILTHRTLADIPPGPGAPPRPGSSGAPRRPMFPADFGDVFTDVLFSDLMPMVERDYRVRTGRENTAMAGLSMGGMQSFKTTLTHLDKFAYIGGFSGSCGGFGNQPFDHKTSCYGAFADPGAFNAKVKVLFLGIGSVEGPGAKNFSNALSQAGIHNTFFESPGTAHEWLTWRRCLYNFAPMLF
jgi:enterochelin esterase family protein